jgi:uncharacterized damage-inducible protein DinB
VQGCVSLMYAGKMDCYSGKDCARSFRTVRKNTIQVANDIPVEQWGFRPTPESMSVHELLAHLAAATTWQLKAHRDDRKTTISFDEFRVYIEAATAFGQALDSRERVLQALETEGEAFASYLESMTSERMAEHVSLPAPIDPPSKSRFEMLLGVKEHEMHHRAQLMVYQRLVGVVPHLTLSRQAAFAARAAETSKQ